MGLVRLVALFSTIWIGLLFIVLGFKVIAPLGISSTSNFFYIGLLLIFGGLFWIVIGTSYVIGELTRKF